MIIERTRTSASQLIKARCSALMSLTEDQHHLGDSAARSREQLTRLAINHPELFLTYLNDHPLSATGITRYQLIVENMLSDKFRGAVSRYHLLAAYVPRINNLQLQNIIEGMLLYRGPKRLTSERIAKVVTAIRSNIPQQQELGTIAAVFYKWHSKIFEALLERARDLASGPAAVSNQLLPQTVDALLEQIDSAPQELLKTISPRLIALTNIDGLAGFEKEKIVSRLLARDNLTTFPRGLNPARVLDELFSHVPEAAADLIHPESVARREHPDVRIAALPPLKEIAPLTAQILSLVPSKASSDNRVLIRFTGQEIAQPAIASLREGNFLDPAVSYRRFARLAKLVRESWTNPLFQTYRVNWLRYCGVSDQLIDPTSFLVFGYSRFNWAADYPFLPFFDVTNETPEEILARYQSPSWVACAEVQTKHLTVAVVPGEQCIDVNAYLGNKYQLASEKEFLLPFLLPSQYIRLTGPTDTVLAKLKSLSRRSPGQRITANSFS